MKTYQSLLRMVRSGLISRENMKNTIRVIRAQEAYRSSPGYRRSSI